LDGPNVADTTLSLKNVAKCSRHNVVVKTTATSMAAVRPATKYTCTICGKAFATSKGKAIHQTKMHISINLFTGTKRVKKKHSHETHVVCDQCHQIFSRSNYKNTHVGRCQGVRVSARSEEKKGEDILDDDLSGNNGMHDATEFQNLLDVTRATLGPTTLSQRYHNDHHNVVTTVDDNVATTLYNEHEMINQMDDYEGQQGTDFLNDGEVQAQLNVPGCHMFGTKKYVMLQKDIRARERDWKSLPRKEHASIVFWSAAQQGNMFISQAQKFVDVIHDHKADLKFLPKTMVTIRKDVKRVAGRWCARHATTYTIPIPELSWHPPLVFVYHNVIQMLADLLQDPLVCIGEMSWKFKERRSDDGTERVYGEISGGTWWEAIDPQIPYGTYLCPVIWNTDEAVMKFGGRASQKPVYVTTGNLSYEARTKDKGIT
jgi:hypothetical protein